MSSEASAIGSVGFVTHPTAHVFPIGDTGIYGRYHNKLRPYLCNGDIDDRVIWLSSIDTRTWEALRSIKQINEYEIIQLQVESKYVCEYLGQSFSALLPVAIVTNNKQRYNAEPKKDSYKGNMAALNASLHFDWPTDLYNLAIDKLYEMQMGLGYPRGNDGRNFSPSLHSAVIDLTNGDQLYCYAYFWQEFADFLQQIDQ